ncbi:ABC transporter permease [Diaphorobacter ruginosibacter]|uniref:ABC transporter permease n=1 Tax=Diaphorobacter ruginosibacter TaxID=1715720 RepID=A0A7G9RRU6_9BURK|nr:ABC transporter permease [Diaphorobacter ruginosibacter]QNN58321.1 ABC transporter permease [Diaphorobacter ruginosibacter]
MTSQGPVPLSELSQWQLLRQDLGLSLRQWPLWMHLGWQDLLRQYRRSFLGPTWIAINMAIFTAAFGWIGAQLFNQDTKTYIPYFCLGNIFFGFLTSMFNDGCKTYIDAAPFLKQASYPKFTFVFRVVWRNLLLLAHQIPLILVVLWYGGLLQGVLWHVWLAGFVLSTIGATLVLAILAAIATRFRDVPMVVSSILQIAFFVTPVMWQSSQLTTSRAHLLTTLNPLAAWLELMRAPLLGKIPSATAFLAAGSTFCVLLVLCVGLYLAVRRRINYWL